ncbi:hypothetical protein BC835DRAFT_1419834 [Cytidiella melzeri]|nr:hypothetical protein BC835DRAFT_1419834 [Cytidiella melzeri]
MCLSNSLILSAIIVLGTLHTVTASSIPHGRQGYAYLNSPANLEGLSTDKHMVLPPALTKRDTEADYTKLPWYDQSVAAGHSPNEKRLPVQHQARTEPDPEDLQRNWALWQALVGIKESLMLHFERLDPKNESKLPDPPKAPGRITSSKTESTTNPNVEAMIEYVDKLQKSMLKKLDLPSSNALGTLKADVVRLAVQRDTILQAVMARERAAHLPQIVPPPGPTPLTSKIGSAFSRLFGSSR